MEEASCFKLLDSYARDRHKCFLAEMSLSTDGKYALCFRPTAARKNSPKQYACRYLHLGADEVRAVGRKGEVPNTITEILDRELPTLSQS